MKHLTTLPKKAITLPEFPENHTCGFIQENLPTNLFDFINLVVDHVKAIF